MKKHKQLTARQQAELLTSNKDHLEILKILEYKPVGFWLSKEQYAKAKNSHGRLVNSGPYLWPGDFIDDSWSKKERAKIIDFLESGRLSLAYMGPSPCRLCDLEFNGTKELYDEASMYTWPEGYTHYIEVHNVKPPQDLIDYVLSLK